MIGRSQVSKKSKRSIQDRRMNLVYSETRRKVYVARGRVVVSKA